MCSKLKAVLVFGATGVIGKPIVDALLSAKSAEGLVSVTIFTSVSTVQSKPLEIQSLKERGADIIIGDIKDDAQVMEAYKGCDTVMSAVGRSVILEQIRLIKLAEASPNVIRFFPSEYGTDIEYNAASANEKPHQAKQKVRDFIRQSTRRLEYTYLVTGPYADLYLGKLLATPQAGTFDVTERKAVLLGSGKDEISLTTMVDVGKLLVAAILRPDSSRNRALRVNSFTTTPDDILAEFERQTEEKWEVQYTSLSDLKRLELEAWEAEHPLASIYTLRRIWTEGGTLYSVRDNGAIGMEDTERLEDAVRRAVTERAEAFRSGDL